MFRFSYNFQGLKIRFAVSSREVFLKKLSELASLAYAGKINDVKFY
jgi:hypothetical protein